MTPKQLREREDAIVDRLEHAPGDPTFLNRLYRDGVPTPKSYLAQPVQVVFVFREPSMSAGAWPEDMRDAVSDERFRPIGADGSASNLLMAFHNVRVIVPPEGRVDARTTSPPSGLTTPDRQDGARIPQP